MDPDNATAWGLTVRDELELRHPTEALKAAFAAERVEPGQHRTLLAEALAAAGRTQESDRTVKQMTSGPGSVGPYDLGIMFARLGDKIHALRCLEQALRERVADLPSIKWDPALDSMRSDPRFQEILTAIYKSR